MKNVLQRKHQRIKKKYFKSKRLGKRHVSQIFLFYIPILKYQLDPKLNDKQHL